jgi:hypothetical protein
MFAGFSPESRPFAGEIILTMKAQLLSRLTVLRHYWKPLLVLVLGLLTLRLLPETVVTVEPESAGEYFPRPESAPLRQRQPAAEFAPAVAVGQRFVSLDELIGAQEASGYVRTGTFGGSWPATVTEVLSRNDAISFTKKDGTRHNYTGFEGYRMQAVRLSGPAQAEVVVVFRSASKR